MKKHVLAATAALVMAVTGGASARAQIPVTDGAALAKLIQEGITASQQLAQLQTQVGQYKTMLASLNPTSNINGVATILQNASVRNLLPSSVNNLGNLTSTNLGSLGSISGAAQAIRNANRIYTAPTDSTGLSDSEKYYNQALEDSGNRAARDMATGQQVASVTTSRQTGLDQLRSQINSAQNPTDILNLQARLQAEQAMISNDSVRLQGVQMQQAAQDKLAQQRAMEEAKKHSDASQAFFDAGITHQ